MKTSLPPVDPDKKLPPNLLLKTPVNTAVGILLATAIALVFWGVFGRIPIRVKGTGMLIPAEGLYEVKSPGDGVIVFPILSEGENEKTFKFRSPPWSEEAYEYQWGEYRDTITAEQTIALATKIINSVRDSKWVRFAGYESGEELDPNLTHTTWDELGVYVQKEDLIAIVDNSSLRKKLRTMLSNFKQRKNYLDSNQKRLINAVKSGKYLYNAHLRRYNYVVPLGEKGAMSEDEVLGYKIKLIEQAEKNNSSASDLLKAKEDYAESKSNLLKALMEYLQNSAVYSFENAWVTAFKVNQRSNVTKGTTLMLLGWDKELEPDEIPIFLDERSFAQISPGMEIIATPNGYSSSEIGGIKGTISGLDYIPHSPETLSNLLAGAGTSSTVSRGTSSIYLAKVKLTRSSQAKINSEARSAYRDAYYINKPDNRGGYEWNNKSNPPLNPREGTVLDISITTRIVAPISLLIPKLKEYSGFSTPHKLIKLQTDPKNKKDANK